MFLFENKGDLVSYRGGILTVSVDEDGLKFEFTA